MQTNISKHPCSGKCTEFNGEQCSHCLIPSHLTELNAVELHDFVVGDVVVLTKELEFVDRKFNTNELLLVVDLTRLGGAGITFDHDVHANIMYVDQTEIRPATTAELKEGRRLPDPVALFVAEAV